MDQRCDRASIAGAAVRDVASLSVKSPDLAVSERWPHTLHSILLLRAILLMAYADTESR